MTKKQSYRFKIKDVLIEAEFDKINETELVLKIYHPETVNIFTEIEIVPKKVENENFRNDETGTNFKLNYSDEYPQHIRPSDLNESDVQAKLQEMLEDYLNATTKNRYRPSKRSFCEVYCRQRGIIIHYTSVRLSPKFKELWEILIIKQKQCQKYY